MTDLTLYTSPGSRGRIARWMLEETGAPYELKVLSAGTSSQDPEYLSINPMGKVPTIVHGKTIVTEAAAICAYLADAFPSASLAPVAEQRGDYYRWLFFAAGPLEAAIANKMFGFVVPDELQKSIGYGNLEKVVDALEGAVSHQPYIAGDEFSAADVYVGSQLGLGIEFGTIDKRPAFETYWARVSQRQAYVRTQELEAALH
jgi:glutathione S-transferase